MSELEQTRWMQEGPDCEKCLGEPLFPGNQDAFKVYQATRSQLIIAPMGGAIAVIQAAVWEWMDRHEHELTKPKNDIFEQVMRVSHEVIADQNEDARLEREADKDK